MILVRLLPIDDATRSMPSFSAGVASPILVIISIDIISGYTELETDVIACLI